MAPSGLVRSLYSEVSPLLGSDKCTADSQIQLWGMDSGLWKDTSVFLTPSSVIHRHFFSPLHGSCPVKWSHYELHTHSRRELQWTPVSTHPQVSSCDPWPYTQIYLGDLRILCCPQHQYADCVGQLCRQCLPACVVVQQCCIIMALFSRGYL